MKVLVTCRQMQVELPEHIDRLESVGLEVLSPPIPGQQFSEDELMELLPGVVGVIAGDDPFSRSVLQSADNLQHLSKWGIGTDGIDKVAAEELGIVVTNTPGMFGDEVADVAMGYVIMLARQLHELDRNVRDGEWSKFEGISLRDQTIGIVGFGSIGRAVAERANAFGMNISVFDPFVSSDDAQAAGVALRELKDLARTSRFVVLTCPLTDDTYHLINESVLTEMSPDSFLVNVARGPVVDEAALIETLENGKIAGAALDVFEVEPLPEDSPLRALPGLIFGTHNGSNTRQGVARTSAKAVDNLIDGLKSGGVI